MTKKIGVVSNESLAGIIERRCFDIKPLIPAVTGQQKSYGERVKGGALEAFIGALYEILGFTWTRTFVLTILSGEIEWYDPAKNSIGTLQEWCQKRGKILPTYLETCRTGPDHNPHFSVRIQIADGRTFEGSGPSLPVARQNAAEMALKNI
jgi:ribonuclease-3